MSPQAFTALLVQEDPKSADLVREHYSDHDDLLIHLLLADLLRLCVSEFHAGSVDVSRRWLALVDRGLRDGDSALENAVLVSFVESAGHGEGETGEFLALWPSGLRTALDEW